MVFRLFACAVLLGGATASNLRRARDPVDDSPHSGVYDVANGFEIRSDANPFAADEEERREKLKQVNEGGVSGSGYVAEAPPSPDGEDTGSYDLTHGSWEIESPGVNYQEEHNRAMLAKVNEMSR